MTSCLVSIGSSRCLIDGEHDKTLNAREIAGTFETFGNFGNFEVDFRCYCVLYHAIYAQNLIEVLIEVLMFLRC